MSRRVGNIGNAKIKRNVRYIRIGENRKEEKIYRMDPRILSHFQISCHQIQVFSLVLCYETIFSFDIVLSNICTLYCCLMKMLISNISAM